MSADAPAEGRVIDGAKSILHYLRRRHGISISRDTLHVLRTDPEREFSCSAIVASPSPFPARTEFNGKTISVLANSGEIDEWVKRHKRAAPD